MSLQINLEMGEVISVLRNLSLGSLSFFKIYSKLKISLVALIFVVVLFFAPVFSFTLFHSGSLLIDFFSCLTGSSQYVHVDCQGKEP